MTPLIESSSEEQEKLLQSTNKASSSTELSENESEATRVSGSSVLDTSPTAIPDDYDKYEPVTHYNSLSVNYQFPRASDIKRGSAQIVELDMGGPNDFWNIHIDFIWRPRKGARKEGGPKALRVTVDHMLLLRLDLDLAEPVVAIYLRGGRLLGNFYFPNGPDAAMGFLTALRKHVETIRMEETTATAKLFLLEKKPRMRRAAPSLMAGTATTEDDGAFETLLQDLDIHSATATQNSRRREQARPRRQGKEGDVGIMILSQFARITQAARDIGEEVSMLLDEKKRRAETERREKEGAARRRALDIYADIVASTDVERELPPRLTLDEGRGTPVSLAVWKNSFDRDGALEDPIAIRQAIFSGGLEPDARSMVWPFILGVFPWNSTEAERASILDKLEVTYGGLKGQWTKLQAAAHAEDEASLAEDPNAVEIDRRKRVSKSHALYLEIEDQIRKDIIRTDRTLDLFAKDDAPATLAMGALLNVYAIYDNSIAYCQGMSDFLSPIIYAIGEKQEALVFWCFESLMRRIERNFRVDQSGMRSQLTKLKKLIKMADRDLAGFFEESDPDYYSCFRWILVSFKREFTFEDIARFWEVLWTQQVGGDDLHIFVAGALLLAHRQQLLSLQRGAFDCLLRYVNDMCMRIDVDFALREGELLFRKYGSKLK